MERVTQLLNHISPLLQSSPELLVSKSSFEIHHQSNTNPNPPSAIEVRPKRHSNQRYTIYVTSFQMKGFQEQHKHIYDQLGFDFIEDCGPPRSEEELLKFAGKFDACIIGTDKFTGRVLEACSPRLKIVQRWGTGFDSVDRVAAKKLGIKVCNVPNAFSIPVAESTLGLILSFARQIPWSDSDTKLRFDWYKRTATTMRETTLGVIGCGNIGKNVVSRAAAFGMRILVNDIIKVENAFLHKYNAKQVSFEELLRSSDFVTVHTTLNETSHHLIDSDALRIMKPTSVLINCSRGPVVCENDIVQALQNKVIAGAGLDVFEHEPLADDSPLRQMENVLLSAHNTHQSPMAYEALHWKAIRNICQVLDIETNRSHETPNFV